MVGISPRALHMGRLGVANAKSCQGVPHFRKQPSQAPDIATPTEGEHWVLSFFRVGAPQKWCCSFGSPLITIKKALFSLGFPFKSHRKKGHLNKQMSQPFAPSSLTIDGETTNPQTTETAPDSHCVKILRFSLLFMSPVCCWTRFRYCTHFLFFAQTSASGVSARQGVLLQSGRVVGP